tara:strand:- start:7878 stop:9035 length:1158 start_codon:yes stop_codon:yes gene_type:complete
MIPYGRQNIENEDIEAVVEVLRSDFITQGPTVERFEAALAEMCGAHAVIVGNSATSMLHAAYLALGVRPGDLVWTTPITFVATANAAIMCGADVGFVDVEPDTGCMSVKDLAARLADAEVSGRLPKLVVPVHFAGRVCDMAAIAALAEKYRFHVVEDAAHAIGAGDDVGPVGACRYSDICVFSFHPVKIITTGEGGAASTQDPELAARLKRLVSHGVTRDETLMQGESEGPWYYQQIELGYNYRMTDIQAALGLAQLTRMPDFIRRRRALAARYDTLLKDLPLHCPVISDPDNSAWHLYVIRLTQNAAPRRRVFEALRARGIGVQVHYIPVHQQPYYQNLGFKTGDYPNAEAFYAVAISLPMFPTLSEQDQMQVVDILRDILTAG